VTVVFDIVFAFAESVPKFDCFITRTRDDLPIIGTEADGQNIGSVANKSPCSGTCIEVPQAKSVVPRRGKGELAVRRYHHVRNEVVVSFEDSFWEAI